MIPKMQMLIAGLSLLVNLLGLNPPRARIPNAGSILRKDPTSLIRSSDITTTPADVYLTYMPMIFRPGPPNSLYGLVTENGIPAAGVPLYLCLMDCDPKSFLLTTTTRSDGSYLFTGVPSLNPGQSYYVLYQNPSDSSNSGRLWTWHTRTVESYTAGNSVHMGDFDLATIPLVAPPNDTTVQLPYTFEWNPRPGRPSDSYEFNLLDYDFDPYFWTYPPVGYVGSYTLNSLPSGFSAGDPYVWEIWVYSPDGGYGISCDSRLVRFSNTGPSIPAGTQPAPSKPVPEEGMRRERRP